MAQKRKNPLLDKQRETSGSTTLLKYLYQYHFGLYTALYSLKRGAKYAVAMEYHEDVIFINELDPDIATFNFHQVKSYKRKLNTNDLLKLEKGSSVLGKLLKSCNGRFYSSKIEDINVVSSEGFKFDDNINNVVDFCITNFAENTKKNIENNIKKELDDESFTLPDNIYFITPSIKEHGCVECIKSLILDLVKNIYGDVYCKANEIYTTLIDDILIKGTVTYSFSNWDLFIREKALTSDNINRVIDIFVMNEKKREEEKNLDEILLEINVGFMERRELKSAYSRYKLDRLRNNILQLDIKNEIVNKINKNINNCSGSIAKLIDLASKDLNVEIAKSMPNEKYIKAAIIYEYLTLN